MKKSVSVVLIVCMIITLALGSGCNNNETSKYENKYVDIEFTEVNQVGITWPEGQALPTFAPPAEELDAINIVGKNAHDRAMISAFAGLINKKQPRVFLHTAEGKYEKWPQIVGLNTSEATKNEEEVIAKYKDEINGLIVWDTKVPDTINLATTLAGIKGGLIVNEKQLEIYESGEFSLPIIEDYRGDFADKAEVYNYMYDNLWKDCNHRLIVGIAPLGWEVRDLAVGSNSAILWLESKDFVQAGILEKFLADCTPGEAYYAGWWDSEGDGVGLGSRYGVATIPSDYYYNYSVYSGTSRELDIPTVPAKPELENKFYISFTLSDGDNLQYDQHAMKTAPQLWASKNRGKYPINWTCSPALLDAGPQLLNHYYQTATDNDVIISGPSGLGYTYPTEWTKNEDVNAAMDKYTKATERYFQRTGIRMVTVWNFIGADHAALYEKNIRSLVGFTVQERLPMQPGQEIVGNRIPLLTTHPRYDGETERVLNILIDECIEPWDESKPGFVVPQLVSWGAGVPDVIKIAEALTEKYGDKVEFVRGDHLMMLYNEAHNIPYNVILQSDGLTASGSDESYDVSQIVDGSFAKDKGWQSSSEGDKWVTVDLKDEYTISRYVMKNAGTGYYSADLNTADFKIQASMDGEKWENIDTVTGNTSNIVDKDVDAFNAKYVRLFITNPGADGVARIQDFEIYGTKANAE